MLDILIFSDKSKNVFLILITFKCFEKVTRAMLSELAFLLLSLKQLKTRKKAP